MKTALFTSLALGLLLAAGAARADGPAQTPAEILQFQHALRAKLDSPTGEYSRFGTDALMRMKRAQDKVFSMLDGVKSMDELSEDKKIEVSNALDELKSILLANEGSRLICRRETKIGTNISTKRCETVADRAARAQQAQRDMQEMSTQSSAQTQHGG